MNIAQKNILLLALKAGELMLKSGGEIYRVEDTVTRICNACGVSNAEVFAMPTGIFVTVDNPEEETQAQTYVKRIKGSSIDLEKISKLNDFSRTLEKKNLSVEESLLIIDEIEHANQFSYAFRLLGASMIASFFTAMLGGTFLDFLGAFFIGGVTYFLNGFVERLHLNWFIEDFIACAFVTFFALILQAISLGDHANLMIIGSIMMFLPGVAITNAVRDFLSGDTLSGLTRAMEAILTAVSIAAGVGLVLQLYSMGGGF